MAEIFSEECNEFDSMGRCRDVVYGKLFPLLLFVRSYSHGLTVPYTHQYSRVSTLEGYQAT